MTQVNPHFPSLPERLQHLGDLAYNLWFSWHSRAVRLFQSLDQKLWEDVSHNPVRLRRYSSNTRAGYQLDRFRDSHHRTC